jgi:hypothetical protein
MAVFGSGTEVIGKSIALIILRRDGSRLVNETGASFSNWTSLAGSWSSTGTVFQQTAEGGWGCFARLATPPKLSYHVHM